MAHLRAFAANLVDTRRTLAVCRPFGLWALCLSFTMLGILPTFAADASRHGHAAEQMQAFATCAGRFSAVAARQVAQHNPDSDRAVRLEHDFDAHVEAILPLALEEGATSRSARHWRIAGWTEMAHLMRLRHSKKDRSRADRAGRAMERRLATCTRMILPG